MRRPTRDARYTRTIGSPPFVGRRYVSGGRVRVEWTEDGKRRQRTVGANTAANRERADQILQDTLQRLRNAAQASEHAEPDPCGGDVADAARALAVAALDLADVMAERLGDVLERLTSELE